MVAANPVFVVGMNGSGTTMLLDCLNNHPKLFGFRGETKIIPHYISSLNKYGEYSVESIATLFESITTKKTIRLTSVSMFKGVLEAICKDKDVFSIVAQAKYNR